MKGIAVLGSTGSIGANGLEIARRFPDRFSVKAITAKSSVELLAEQIIEFRPEVAAVYDEERAAALGRLLPRGSKTELLYGAEGYRAAATLDSVKSVLTAVVGAAGLEPTLAAIDAGKEIALANKETLVMAGEIVMTRAAEKGVKILPVDSEHSAIFQCLAGQNRKDLEKILLTASGGPFRNRDITKFSDIRPEDALNHPTWQMGPKITIDSATLMNKGLEVIEASHLFGVTPDRIEVVVHPQSIVHSMVAYKDGSVIAQLGIPDMKGAIAYGLSWPERLPLPEHRLDPFHHDNLTFERPDLEKFQCLALAFAAIRTGGTMPAVLNAANEIAVAAFLDQRISFPRIPALIKETMEAHTPDISPDLDAIIAADSWARNRVDEALRKD